MNNNRRKSNKLKRKSVRKSTRIKKSLKRKSIKKSILVKKSLKKRKSVRKSTRVKKSLKRKSIKESTRVKKSKNIDNGNENNKNNKNIVTKNYTDFLSDKDMENIIPDDEKRPSKKIKTEKTSNVSNTETKTLTLSSGEKYEGNYDELPLDLIVLIASYLSMKDQRTLSHCSKSFRSIMRTANLIRYKLSNESCRKYVDDLEFRELVDSRGRVWELKFGKSALDTDTSLVDVSFLSCVQILKLQNCSAIIDVSPLSSVHTLTLDSMDGVTDVSALTSVHTLKLVNMSGVTDVSALSSVHTLTLESLDVVTDVSALSEVHTLTLKDMEGVRDVSALANVHTLTIIDMPEIDTSVLTNVKNLTIE